VKSGEALGSREDYLVERLQELSFGRREVVRTETSL